jgi:hypothetical protein
MKKIVIVCGLIAGGIEAAMMVVMTVLMRSNENYHGSLVLGYATMLLAFSLVFVGVKNFRDKYNDGVISFGKAFKTGLYITLIASTIYVLVWLVDYYVFVPDYLDRYASEVIQQAKSSGATAAEIDKKMLELATYKEMYKNPLFVVLFTYAEILPVGFVVSFITALILKRKKAKANVEI